MALYFCPGCGSDIATHGDDCGCCGRLFTPQDEVAQRRLWPAFATKAIEDARFEFALVQGDD